jgi:hypothetical protein
LATGKVPVTPEVKGNPVALVSVAELGVPNTGVTNVGLVANTLLPEPVLVTLTSPLLESVATAEEAVNEDNIGCAVNVATPVTPKVVLSVALVPEIAPENTVLPLNVKLDANLAVVTEPSDGTPACDKPIDVTRINVPTVGVKPNVKLTPLTE